MHLALKWTHRASRQLDEIEAYIAAERPEAAAREIQRIIERCQQLVHFPHLGPVHSVKAEAEFRVIVVGNYRVFYVIKTAFERIDIVTVWHGARGEPEL